MKDLKIDSEFKNLVPAISDIEYSELEKSIKAEGCRDALVVWRDKNILLDGHNRYKICQQHNIGFKIKELHFEDRDSAVMWIIKTHFARRNLTVFSRCELALKLKPLIAKEAKEHQRLSRGRGKKGLIKKINLIDTEQEIAKIAGVSKATINKVAYILENGNEEEIERGRTGNHSINRIKGEILRRVVKEEFEKKIIESEKRWLKESKPTEDGTGAIIKYYTDKWGNKRYSKETRPEVFKNQKVKSVYSSGVVEYNPEYLKLKKGEADYFSLSEIDAVARAAEYLSNDIERLFGKYSVEEMKNAYRVSEERTELIYPYQKLMKELERLKSTINKLTLENEREKRMKNEKVKKRGLEIR